MEGSTKGKWGGQHPHWLQVLSLFCASLFFPSCFVHSSYSFFYLKGLMTMKNVEALSVTDSSGRQVSLLNNESAPPDHLEKRTTPTTPSAPPPPSLPPHVVQHNVTSLSPPNANTRQPVMYNQTPNTTQWTSYRQQRSATAASSSNDSNSSRRKYHCTEPGCNKSFTTRYVCVSCVSLYMLTRVSIVDIWHDIIVFILEKRTFHVCFLDVSQDFLDKTT